MLGVILLTTVEKREGGWNADIVGALAALLVSLADELLCDMLASLVQEYLDVLVKVDVLFLGMSQNLPGTLHQQCTVMLSSSECTKDLAQLIVSQRCSYTLCFYPSEEKLSSETL